LPEPDSVKLALRKSARHLPSKCVKIKPAFPGETLLCVAVLAAILRNAPVPRNLPGIKAFIPLDQ
jgi:hypothetical protein